MPESRLRDFAPFVGMALLFLTVEFIALALVPTFYDAGLQATETPSDPLNTVVYVAFILVFTGILLLVIKYDI
ncbi:MAG: presenilin family intramembrane aspartyl protease, partial [Halobacteria archaeon]|nr:presenilin family intramembrane aspartyl protease [Halobacteria archaeon]